MSTTTETDRTFRRGELAAIKRMELGAVVILDVGGKIAIGATADPRAYARHYGFTKAPCRIAAIRWTLDTAFARRIRDAAGATLAGRRVGDAGLFDVPEHLAMAAVEIAASKAKSPLMTTERLLADMREDKERRLEELMKATRLKWAHVDT